MNGYHTPVLLKEAIAYLNVRPGQKYIDATTGGGGYTEEIIKLGGKVLAIDRDQKSIDYIKKKNFKNLKLINDNYSHIYKIAEGLGFKNVAGIVFDLGVSSHQLEDAKRGFSFQKNGPLDMRMDPKLSITASDIVNNFEKRRLYEIFHTFGEEKLSWPIASAICGTRQIKSINTTNELANLISEVYAKNRVKTKIHPATKVFQALRIVVNSEDLNLEEALPQTINLLKEGGRLVVVSFHSLEDGSVKRFFKDAARMKVLTQKPIGPTKEEIGINPRARSAKLRAAEKI